MSRRFLLAIAFCSSLVLLGSAPPSHAANPTPVMDDGSPPGPQVQVIVCPDSNCIECGNPGLICCHGNNQCIVIWMPIWFRTSGAAPIGPVAAVAPAPACPVTAPRPWYGR